MVGCLRVECPFTHLASAPPFFFLIYLLGSPYDSGLGPPFSFTKCIFLFFLLPICSGDHEYLSCWLPFFSGLRGFFGFLTPEGGKQLPVHFIKTTTRRGVFYGFIWPRFCLTGVIWSSVVPFRGPFTLFPFLLSPLLRLGFFWSFLVQFGLTLQMPLQDPPCGSPLFLTVSPFDFLGFCPPPCPTIFSFSFLIYQNPRWF